MNSLSAALQKETEKILGCIHCGLCLPSCPTYQQLGNENDSPRGRIYLMRSVVEGRLDVKSESFSRHIDLCLGCRACETACPAGVNYGSLLETARQTLLEVGGTKGPGIHRIMLSLALRHIFPHPSRLRAAMAIARSMRNLRLLGYVYRKGLIRGISAGADFALSLLMSTRPAFGNNGKSPAKGVRETGSRPVTVFTGCVMDGLFRHTNDATRRVLAVNDCRAEEIPEQVCCGALHAHAGYLETARELARRNIDAFEGFIGRPGGTQTPPTIIINAAGCGALLKEYGDLLKDDPDYAARAENFSRHVKDVTEFLAQGEIRKGAALTQRVSYDAPCHLFHAQGITTAPQKVLASIPGIEFVQLEGMQDCCGGAGIYNLSEPELSERILADKISKVKATGAEVLTTANPGCQMQLSAGARMFDADCRVTHVVDLLDESYRRAGFYLEK